MASFALYGQRNAKVDPKDAQIDTLKVQVDSLSKVSKSLTLQLDSVSGELVKYLGLYNTIKDKVIHYAFDPTRSAYLIDSLAGLRYSAAARNMLGMKTAAATPDTLKAAPAVLPPVSEAALPPEEVQRALAVSAIKQLKELLDAKIITDAEFLTLKQKYLGKL